jgi:WD40 repeat protein/tRNA A-37 threonylcarbamoyl transferase component Bud32
MTSDPSDADPSDSDSLPLPLAREIDRVCDAFGAELRADKEPRIEDFLDKVAASGRSSMLRELIVTELEFRISQGSRPEPDAWHVRFLHDRPAVDAALARLKVGAGTPPGSAPPLPAPGRSLTHAGTAGDPELEKTVPFEQGSPRGRFRILRPHAKGGLGQVSVALDQDLNREVALKEIQPKHADDPISRERFLLEAEITGGLEHPGIVPVYALGQDPDGRPFYAMRFVRGDSLQQAIEDFHRADHPSRKDPGARQLALRQLLGRFIDVCNAMEYAHSRGVLHRDLKPRNIMVGKYGETLVVDWGLAKALGKKENLSDEATLLPSAVLSSSGRTQAGTPMGTPAYMSPEQAAGKSEELSPASDVYSLGATLYHVLCGRPPFDKQEYSEVVVKVERGDFPRPRSIEHDVPVPLEAICLKAMALRPADRYQTARMLGDDLEHWLADEPVGAAPDTLISKLGRFGRHHRGAVHAGAIASAALALISTIAAVAIDQQRRENKKLAEEKSALAEVKDGLATQNFKLARSEAEARSLAQQRADKLQANLARSLVDHGLREYDHGLRENEQELRLAALVDLTRAWVMTPPTDPMYQAYTRVLIDRSIQGGQLLVPPLWHAEEISSAAFSPDGTRIVTGSADKTARLWDARTGAPVGEVMRHDWPVTFVEFSPDGSCIVTQAHETVRLWNAQTGSTIGQPMQNNELQRPAISPDGGRIATVSDEIARLWDPRTGTAVGEPMENKGFYLPIMGPDDEPIASLNNGTARLSDVSIGPEVVEMITQGTRANFSPDGTRLCTISSDGEIARLWDAQNAAPLGEPTRHEPSIVDVRFHRDRVFILTKGGKSIVRILDAETGALLGGAVRKQASFSTAALSPDGTLVITTDNSQAQFWDTATGNPVGQPIQHPGPILSTAFSPDGTRVVTACSDGTARLWDSRTGNPIGVPMIHEATIAKVQYVPDGSRVVTLGAYGTARLWHANSGAPASGLMRVKDPLAFSRDGRRVIGTGWNSARLYDSQFGLPVGIAMNDGLAVEIGSNDGFFEVALSPDGSRFFASSIHVARLWETQTGIPCGMVIRHASQILCAAFSPDGQRIVTGSADSTAQIWDTLTGAPSGKPLRHNNDVSAAAFSPDGTRFLTGDIDGFAQLWDEQTKARIGKPMRHQGRIIHLAFSPDGTRIVTADNQGLAQLWDAQTSAPLGNPMRHEEGLILSLRFNADGTRIITISHILTRLWDAQSGSPVGEPMRRAVEMRTSNSILSPDGERIIAYGSDRLQLLDRQTGATLGELMPDPQPAYGVHHAVEFSDDGTHVVVALGGSVQIWDVSEPGLLREHPEKMLPILQLWTGIGVNSDGSLRPPSAFELDQIRRQIGDEDPLRKFVYDRASRRDIGFRSQAGTTAEEQTNLRTPP